MAYEIMRIYNDSKYGSIWVYVWHQDKMFTIRRYKSGKQVDHLLFDLDLHKHCFEKYPELMELVETLEPLFQNLKRNAEW